MFEIELKSRSTLASVLPRQLYIEVTNHCNSLCISCPLTYDHFLPIEPKQHLSWENFRRIVDPLPRWSGWCCMALASRCSTGICPVLSGI